MKKKRQAPLHTSETTNVLDAPPERSSVRPRGEEKKKTKKKKGYVKEINNEREKKKKPKRWTSYAAFLEMYVALPALFLLAFLVRSADLVKRILVLRRHEQDCD